MAHEEERAVKQVIVIRRDLGMRRGKEIAQGAHASMAWLSERLGHPAAAPGDFHTVSLTEAQLLWLGSGFRKVTCQAGSEEELRGLHREAEAAGLAAHLVTDMGLTEFNGIPTVTALAIGPDFDSLVDTVTGKLKLY